VEAGRLELNPGDRLLVYLETSGIGIPIEHGTDPEAGGSARTGDQLDDYLVADQGPAAPILADDGEEAMLDLVSLACPGREVADGDRQSDLIGQFL
jgi:hypothetical protein